MRRILTAVLLVFFALGLATPALADKGDRWRGRDQHQQHDNGNRPSRNNDQQGQPPNTDYQGNDGQYQSQNQSGNDRPWYGRRREHDRAREGVMRGRMIPLEDLENRIARTTPGYRIGNPEFLMFGGRPVYRIRWRTPDGHILIVFADAETGQVIDIRGR